MRVKSYNAPLTTCPNVYNVIHISKRFPLSVDYRQGIGFFGFITSKNDCDYWQHATANGDRRNCIKTRRYLQIHKLLVVELPFGFRNTVWKGSLRTDVLLSVVSGPCHHCFRHPWCPLPPLPLLAFLNVYIYPPGLSRWHSSSKTHTYIHKVDKWPSVTRHATNRYIG